MCGRIMSSVMVSIILPTKNSLPYLYDRLSSLTEQTLTNWELLVIDGFSTDGTWEILCDFAEQDGRVVSLEQSRVGLYESWNQALKKACAKYVYIATSDDLMMPIALERMVAALEYHQDCGICDTRLCVVNEEGSEIPDYVESLPIGRYLANSLNTPHIRRFPHDAVLHLTGNTVFTSIAQILFRRTLLTTCGYFEPRWGSRSDFEWGFRISLQADTLFLPQPLTSWRKHPLQATQNHSRPFHKDKYEMSLSALKKHFLNSGDRRLEKKFITHLDFLAVEAIRDSVRSDSLRLFTLYYFKMMITHPARFFELHAGILSKGARAEFYRKHLLRLSDQFNLRGLIETL